MDIPIDPALLEEEGGLEDAEGEVDDEYLIDEGYVDEGDSYEQSYPVQQHATPPTPRASSSRSEIVATPLEPPVMKKRRGRPPGSITKNRKSDLNGHGPVRAHVNGHGHVKGKGKGRASSSAAHVRSDSVETNYIGAAPEWFCSFCEWDKDKKDVVRNMAKSNEKMVSCCQCGRSGHPSCLCMGPALSKYVMTYNWKCIECKACEICGDGDNKVMFCDGCDRGYHYWCLDPPLPSPPTGTWYCGSCHRHGRARKHKSTSEIVTPSSERSKHTKHPKPIIHPPPLVDTPSSMPRRGRPPKSLQASRLSQSIKWDEANSTEEEDVFAHRPRIKIKTNGRKDKGKGRQVDESPFVVKIRVPSGGARKAVEVEDEEEKVPYGGVITGADAETTKTTITEPDKLRFQKSLSAAESKLGGPAVPLPDYDPQLSVRGSPAPSMSNGHVGESSTPSLSRSNSTPHLARGLRDRLLQQSTSMSGGSPGPSSSTPNGVSHLRDRQPGTSTSEKIKTIRFGVFDIDTWYSAPYPEEYQNVPDGRLWLCEFCLKYMKSGFVAGRHRLKCKTRHPPGDEIYRDGNISVFEVDGRKNKIYCQNLCLLAKMFLDHKTLYYDVEPFLFYVMTEVDDLGARFVGYFSKEKRSLDNNVSCIMTLPVRQRKGWGQLLIDFSYALSKKENRVGSPEKPLSGLGAVTYKRYWKITVFDFLRNAPANVTMDDISAATSMTIEDIYTTLLAEVMITSLDSPPRSHSTFHTPTQRRGRGRGRGRGSINRRTAREDTQNDTSDPDKDKPIIPKSYTIRFDRAYVEAVMSQHESRGYLKLNPDRLKYHPFLVTRDPLKPPGTIAKAALTAGLTTTTTTAEVDAEGTEADEADLDDPEVINHGQDKATLELVAKLSESPARSLRKRPATSSAEPASIDRQTRQKRARRTTSQIDSPRRSMRGAAAAAAAAVPAPEVQVVELVNGRGDLGTPFVEDDGDVDAEGEEVDGDWEVDEVDAEGEDEYVE